MVKTPKKIHKLIPVVLLLILAVIPLTASAQLPIDLNVNYPPIPTPIGPVDLNCLEVGLCDFSIALMVLVVYSATIWIAGLLALVILVYTGFTYIVGGASPGARRKAKRMFINVLWGLAILLLSNALLITINDNILQLDEPNLFGIDATESIYRSPKIQGEGLPNVGGGSGGSGSGGGGGGGEGGNIEEFYDSCTSGQECEDKYGEEYTCDRSRNICIGKYEECVYNTDGDDDLAVCWDFLLGGGSLYDRERPGCGTAYSPNCHTLTQIKSNVRQDLDEEFSSAVNPTKVANTFFDNVVPGETGQTWNPAAEAKLGVSCTPVGLYQLEDRTRSAGGTSGSCPEGTHKDEDYAIETNHAADVYFRRGCHYWSYFKNTLGLDNKSECDAWESS